jgi:hypothetical protein
MKRGRFPQRIKRGSCVVKIYRTPTRGYDSFTVVHYDTEGKFCRRTFADYAEARSAAEDTADNLAEGKFDSYVMTGQELFVYQRATEALKPAIGTLLRFGQAKGYVARDHPGVTGTRQLSAFCGHRPHRSPASSIAHGSDLTRATAGPYRPDGNRSHHRRVLRHWQSTRQMLRRRWLSSRAGGPPWWCSGIAGR